jgi:hypothetical protein
LLTFFHRARLQTEDLPASGMNQRGGLRSPRSRRTPISTSRRLRAVRSEPRCWCCEHASTAGAWTSPGWQSLSGPPVYGPGGMRTSYPSMRHVSEGRKKLGGERSGARAIRLGLCTSGQRAQNVLHTKCPDIEWSSRYG